MIYVGKFIDCIEYTFEDTYIVHLEFTNVSILGRAVYCSAEEFLAILLERSTANLEVVITDLADL